MPVPVLVFVRRCQPRGYAWVFHDLTTLRRGGRRVARRYNTALPGPAAGAGAGGLGDGGAEGPLTEVAVAHVLASVTEKARKHFDCLLHTNSLALPKVVRLPTTTTGRVHL